MGHHHHGHPLPGQGLHHLQHLPHHLRVQGAGGLVKEHHLRLHAEGPDDGHPLLLAAGKLDGVGVGAVPQANTVQKGQGLLLRLLLGHLLHLHGGKGHVLQDGQVGEQVEVLEHHPHLLAVVVDVHPPPGDVHPLEDDLPAAGLLQQVQGAEEGGLAGAGGPHDDHHVPFVDIHAHMVQGVYPAVKGLDQVLHLDKVTVGRHGASSFQSKR